jgi:hypothetical protein
MTRSSPALPCASVGASAAHEPDGHSWRTVFTEPTRRNPGRETVGFLPECRRSALSSARATGCASLGALLFFARAKKSKQKKARPCIRPCATRRVRSLHRSSRGRLTRAIHGPLSLSPHPCGSSPYATIPLTLLTGDRVLPASPRMDKRTPVRRNVGWKTAQHFPPLATSKFTPGRGVLLFKPVGKLRVTHPTDLGPHRAESVRPPERGVLRRLMVCWPEKSQSVLLWLVKSFHATRTPVPVRRPSAVAVEGVERHGCRESCDGPGMALRSVPPERRWSEGTLRAAKGRMPGSPSLWLLSLGETRESDAPCKAQPVGGAEESAAPHRSTQATADTHCIRKRRTSSPSESHPCPNRQRHALRINPEAASLPSRGELP